MDCRKIEDWMPAYIEGDLATADMRRVDAHLETCEACRQSMAFFTELESVLEARRELLPSSTASARRLTRRVGLARSWGLLPALRGLPAMISGGLIVLGVVLFAARGVVASFLAGLGNIHFESDLVRELSSFVSFLLGMASAGNVLTWSIVFAGVLALIFLSGSWMVLRFVRE